MCFLRLSKSLLLNVACTWCIRLCALMVDLIHDIHRVMTADECSSVMHLHETLSERPIGPLEYVESGRHEFLKLLKVH